MGCGWKLPGEVHRSKSAGAQRLREVPPVPMKIESGSSEEGYWDPLVCVWWLKPFGALEKPWLIGTAHTLLIH